MFRKNLPLILVSVLLLAACRMPAETQEPQPPEYQIATSVAATLAAKSGAPLPTAAPAEPTASAPDATAPPSTATAIPSPTSTPSPTATPTSTPTETPTPTPTEVPGDPAEVLGVPSWKDNFQSKDNWNGFEDSQSKFVLKEGAFYLTAKKANSYEAWTISWPVIKNYYLEYTGEFGEECTGKDRFGMIFRAPNFNEGYLFGISCDGSYRLSAWDGEEYTVLKSWTRSPHLNQGSEAQNRFGIKAKDQKLTGYLNGHEAFSITVDMYNKKGKFGVFAAASKTPGFTAQVTRVRYWELP